MFSLTDLADTVAAQVLAFADLLDTLDAPRRRAPTPCADWTIDDLAEHVATGAIRDAEAFHRARFGTLRPPGDVTLDGTDPATALRLAVDHLRHALAQGPRRWPTVPTPFGGYPVAAALQSLIVEFGVHRNDLEIAAGTANAPFSTATVEALFAFGEHYLLRQAAPLEGPAVTFTFAAPSASMSATWTGRRWIRGTGAARECRIAASDDAIARLMLRRIDIGDPRIDLLDPHGLAALYSSAIQPL